MEILLLVFVGMNLFLALLTLPMIAGTLPPNRWYGFRTRATLSDPDLWYPVNQYSGKWLLVTSLISAMAAIVLYTLPGMTVDIYPMACLVFVVISTILTMRSSFRYLRSLQKK